MYSSHTYITADNFKIHWHKWLSPKEDARPLVIIHGMSEHAQRYGHFASYLNRQGFHVYAMDLRGHGQSIRPGQKGGFADQNGWFTVVEDIAAFVEMVRGLHSQTPVLLGHSMGSLLLRSYCIEHQDQKIEKVILSGSTRGLASPVMKAAWILAKGMRMAKKPWEPSPFMDRMIFGAYGNSVPNPRTPFDWISRSDEIVDAYMTDPLCGFVCSSQFYLDLVEGLIHCNDLSNMDKMKNKQDLLFLSGSEDPVGNMGKDISFFKTFFSCQEDPSKCQAIVYSGYRHEILNELGREKVYEDIVHFINRR